jgi:hypothetical protein
MRRFSPLLLTTMLVFAFFSSSWAQFPCNPGDSVETCCGADSGHLGYSWDLGYCDTLHVLPWPKTDTCFIGCGVSGCDTICINNPGERFPCFLYVPLLVTHDSNTFWWEEWGMWAQDSIIGFVVPLAWTHTNPTAYCSLSAYWNQNVMGWWNPRFPRSIWRHFQHSELDSNRMARLADQDLGWDAILNMASDSSWYYFNAGQDSAFVPPHLWLALLRLQETSRRWWEGERTLLATLTFRIEDTMHVCLDSTWWPPSSQLKFTRLDVKSYVPRHSLPFCVSVPPPRIEVTSPNGSEIWCTGSTRDITWISEKFTGDVKIEYSTNGGNDWIEIAPSTENDSVYSWTVPDTTSTSCLMKISDPSDGDPYDKSDDYFTIADQSIGVIFPDGGETLIVDSTYEMTWSWTCIDSFKIEYSTDGGSSFMIVDTTESGGNYSWEVPDTPSDSCLVRICDLDEAPCNTSDSSFTIVLPDFAIHAYPDTQSVQAGQEAHYYVTLYSLYGFSSPCTLSVSDLPPGATGAFDQPIIAYPYTDTSTLTIATSDTVPGDEFTITITGTEMSEGKNAMEHSTQVVLLVTRILVTSPDGEEHWCIGKSRQINWSSEGFFGPFVKIDYSTNGGASWLPIEDRTINDGTYFWVIPDTPSDSCLVRVSDVEDGDPYGQSHGFFTIFLAGDANANGSVDMSDAVYLVNYLFIHGPAPPTSEAGDANADGEIDLADVVYLVNYLFLNWSPPRC